MTCTAIIVLLATAPGQSGTKTYANKILDLTFQRPAGWEYKKGKYGEEFRFVASDGSPVVVQIFETKFRQAPETWQSLQSEMSLQMGRKVARQWEEQILGVPLLLTQAEFAEQGSDKATIVGLLYAATENKLNFRCTTAKSAMAEAEELLRASLMTLRTMSGEMPSKDDPTKPLVKRDVNEKGQKIFRITEASAFKAKAENAATVFVLGRNVNVTLPKGWTIAQAEEGADLKSPDGARVVHVEIAPGNEEIAETYAAAFNASEIGNFKVVSLREDTGWKASPSGSRTLVSFRSGTDNGGAPRFTWAVAGAKEGLAWSFTIAASDEKSVGEIKRTVADLTKTLAFQFAE